MLLWVGTGWAWHDPLVSLLLMLVLLAVLGGIAVVAAGHGDSLEQEPPDRAPYGALGDGDVGSEDVDRLRFSLAFRGYRMDEVDEVLDRLVDQLAARDARIAELEGRDLADESLADLHDGRDDA
jgi:DivIVA domain-containing protein